MSLGQFVTGMAFLLPTLGAVIAAAAVVTHRRYRYLPPLARSLAFMVLATAGLVFSTVAPAALGLLARPSVLIAAVLVLGAALLVPTGAANRRPAEALVAPPSGLLSILIAVIAVVVVVVYELARLRTLGTQPPTEIDVLGFHLPGIARIIQSGTLWRVDQFEPGFATSQYPNNGDFAILAAVLPWRSLAFVRFVPLPFYTFTAIGTYALALELRSSRAAAATVAAAVTTVPAMAGLALEGLPDVIALSTLAAGLVFLIRHSRSGRTSDLVLAGLALGLSFGTKWYCTTAVTVVLVVWVLARALARIPPARLVRDAGIGVGMVLVGGGFWLLRNLVESGNPIYPKAVSLFGAQLFAGSHNDVIDQYGYTIADYLTKPHILRTFIYPGFKIEVGLTGAVIVVGVVIAAVAAVARLRRRVQPRTAAAAMLALAIAAVGMAALYTITPGSAYGARNIPIEAFVNIRWLMPAIIVAGALTAAAAGALGRVGLLLELAALAGAIDGIHLGASVSLSDVVVAVLAVAIVGGAVLACGLAWRRRLLPRSPQSAIAAAVLSCIVLVILARADQNSFDRHSYASADPTFAWIDAHAPTGQRVGITGVASINGLSPVLPAFGPRLGNVVSYVGDPVRHSLHLPVSQRSFDTELRRGRYGLLLVGLQEADHTDVWAQAAGYRLVAESPRLALYAAPGMRTR